MVFWASFCCPRDCAKRISMGCAGSSEAKGEGESIATSREIVWFAVVFRWLYQFFLVCFWCSLSVQIRFYIVCYSGPNPLGQSIRSFVWDLIGPRQWTVWLVSQINLLDACKLARTPRLSGEKNCVDVYVLVFVCIVASSTKCAGLAP